MRVPLHEPHALPVEKVAVPQRSHRAEINHIARHFVLERLAGKNVDFLVRTTIGDHQFARPGYFPAETHTAAAHHTAVDEQRDGFPQFAAAARERFQIGAARVLAVPEVVVLQQALPRLVADRTVDRMANEQILFHQGPRVSHFLAVGHKHRAVDRRRLAGGYQLGQHGDLAGLRITLPSFHETHAATRHDAQTGMPAIMRDFDPGPRRDLDPVELLAFLDLDLLSVNDDLGHVSLLW